MSDRYFENTLVTGVVGDPEVVREILKAAAVALKEVKAAAIQHQDVSGGSIYVGVAGVALTYLHIAQQVQRGVRFEHGAYLRKHDVPHCLNLADMFLTEAEKLMSNKRVTFLEGASGVLAAQAVLAHMQGNWQTTAAKLQAVQELWPNHIQGVLPPSECELLYGRAGYLYSLAWLQQHLGQEAVPQDLIKAVTAHILNEGLRGGAELRQSAAGGGGSRRSTDENLSSAAGSWDLMYSWHGKKYLGAAHGLSGILYVLLHCMPVVQELDRERGAAAPAGYSNSGGGSVGGSSSTYSQAIHRTVSALAGATFASGNLPTKLGDNQDLRVSWCHGASGFLLTMLKAAEVLGDGDGRYMAAAVAAADDIRQRGLLKKGVGLCHGISGNGYALLACAKATGQPHCLAAAQAFALFGVRNWRQLYLTPDRPASLYEGLAGAVNFWLDAVYHQEAKWPGAEL